MEAHRVRRIVFSSLATVYGMADEMPLNEASPTGPVNPYGHSKIMVERMLLDLAQTDPHWRVMCLRYFNPVGAHESGMICEDPRGTPNNLMPFVAQVAVGRLPRLKVFGDDYPTPDGTEVRDYIHVMDLARGHAAALKRLLAAAPRHSVLNLGTGRGHSVLAVVRAFEHASGRPLPYEIAPRREGDVASSYANVALRGPTWAGPPGGGSRRRTQMHGAGMRRIRMGTRADRGLGAQRTALAHTTIAPVTKIDLQVLDERIREHLPTYATASSAGMDLRACIEVPLVIAPGSTELIPAKWAPSAGWPNSCMTRRITIRLLA